MPFRSSPGLAPAGLEAASRQDFGRHHLGRRQGWRAAGRASICGYVDAYALLKLGVYASFMTGNTTTAGVRAAGKQFSMAGHSLLPIPSFLFGILAATLLTYADERRALHRLSALAGGMLLVATAAALLHCPDWLSIVILGSAMGVTNASVSNVDGQPVSVGFMSGDLSNLAKEVADGLERKSERVSPWRKSSVLAALWVAFLCGALAGALLVPRYSAWTLTLPGLALLGFGWRERLAITAPQALTGTLGQIGSNR
jgi:uncharacterized membrane protein YoaK (UPF0700 family)